MAAANLKMICISCSCVWVRTVLFTTGEVTRLKAGKRPPSPPNQTEMEFSERYRIEASRTQDQHKKLEKNVINNLIWVEVPGLCMYVKLTYVVKQVVRKQLFIARLQRIDWHILL